MQDLYRGMTSPLENSTLKGVEGASSLVSEEGNSLISRRDIALRNKAERKLFLQSSLGLNSAHRKQTKAMCLTYPMHSPETTHSHGSKAKVLIACTEFAEHFKYSHV